MQKFKVYFYLQEKRAWLTKVIKTIRLKINLYPNVKTTIYKMKISLTAQKLVTAATNKLAQCLRNKIIKKIKLLLNKIKFLNNQY